MKKLIAMTALAALTEVMVVGCAHERENENRGGSYDNTSGSSTMQDKSSWGSSTNSSSYSGSAQDSSGSSNNSDASRSSSPQK